MWRLPTTLLLLTMCSCGDASPEICARPESEEPTAYCNVTVDANCVTGGRTENGIYRSAELGGELLHYPGGAYYQLRHGLGAVPTSFDVYLSFERTPLDDEASLAEAAGNQAEIKALDAETITVLNGTCADFYMLAVVRAD